MQHVRDESVLQCVAVCCSLFRRLPILQYRAQMFQFGPFPILFATWRNVCCSVLPCVAVRCKGLRCVAVCCALIADITIRSFPNPLPPRRWQEAQCRGRSHGPALHVCVIWLVHVRDMTHSHTWNMFHVYMYKHILYICYECVDSTHLCTMHYIFLVYYI